MSVSQLMEKPIGSSMFKWDFWRTLPVLQKRYQHFSYSGDPTALGSSYVNEFHPAFVEMLPRSRLFDFVHPVPANSNVRYKPYHGVVHVDVSVSGTEGAGGLFSLREFSGSFAVEMPFTGAFRMDSGCRAWCPPNGAATADFAVFDYPNTFAHLLGVGAYTDTYYPGGDPPAPPVVTNLAFDLPFPFFAATLLVARKGNQLVAYADVVLNVGWQVSGAVPGISGTRFGNGELAFATGSLQAFFDTGGIDIIGGIGTPAADHFSTIAPGSGVGLSGEKGYRILSNDHAAILENGVTATDTNVPGDSPFSRSTTATLELEWDWD